MLVAALVATALIMCIAVWDIATDRDEPAMSWRRTVLFVLAVFSAVIFAVALSVVIAP